MFFKKKKKKKRSWTGPIQGFLAPCGNHSAPFTQERAWLLISKKYTKHSFRPLLSLLLSALGGEPSASSLSIQGTMALTLHRLTLLWIFWGATAAAAAAGNHLTNALGMPFSNGLESSLLLIPAAWLSTSSIRNQEVPRHPFPVFFEAAPVERCRLLGCRQGGGGWRIQSSPVRWTLTTPPLLRPRPHSSSSTFTAFDRVVTDFCLLTQQLERLKAIVWDLKSAYRRRNTLKGFSWASVLMSWITSRAKGESMRSASHRGSYDFRTQGNAGW